MPFFRPVLSLAAFALLFFLPNRGMNAQDHVMVQLADGFDLPVGKPDGVGYYVYRGYTQNGHLGEDWNGKGMGNTDLGDPIYACANGLVIFSEDYRHGWGNVIIVRHAYRGKDGQIAFIDSLYGHFQKRYKKVGDHVVRGETLGTIGRGPKNMYTAHLHFEIRKDLRVGMARTKYPKTYAVYYSPRDFIREHRKIRFENRKVPTPINTFMKSNPNRLTVTKVEVPSLAPPELKAGPDAPPIVEKAVQEQTNPVNAQPAKTKGMWEKLLGVFGGSSNVKTKVLP